MRRIAPQAPADPAPPCTLMYRSHARGFRLRLILRTDNALHAPRAGLGEYLLSGDPGALQGILKRITGIATASRQQVVMTATQPEQNQRAEDIRAHTSQLKLRHRGQLLGPVSVSVGLAVRPLRGTHPETPAHAADLARYRARQGGRNRVAVASREPAHESGHADN